jgi:diaminohydroxyphosphoribosylaminopyrimidine deaminase/5-amino-6-(5-phosphoribosylamino)uracil reductase
VFQVRGRGGRAVFADAVKALAARGITRLLIEGGGEVAAAALRAELVDEVALFVAPVFIGAGGVAAIGPLAPRSLERAPRLASVHVEPVGTDFLVRGLVRYGR